MAASKKSPAKPVSSSNRKSVSQSGGRATARKAVAQRDAGRRATPKVAQSARAILPPVPEGKPTQVQEAPTRYPHIDPTVLAAAFARARRGLAWTGVEWDAEHQRWDVPSASEEGKYHQVHRAHGKRGRLPFWVALVCNCDANTSGSYLVCWHKCAVKIRWDYALAERVAEQQGGPWPDPTDF